MASEIRVTFPYSVAEHAEAAAQSVSGRRLRQFMRLFGVLSIATGVLVSLVGFLKDIPLASALSEAFPFLPLGAFWAWGGPAILSAANRRQLRREAHQEGRDRESVLLGADGITPGSKWSQPIPWSQVRRVSETSKLIVLDASSDGPAYVPKHALSAEDRENLETLLREQFRSRPEDLRLKSAPNDR